MNSFTESQGTLARLLAKENITIQHGAYSTAFFDVKHRILGLPTWKDLNKDVYDLLCGHEVGHALYTPADGLDNLDGLRKDYLNVVEDVRIESMIQETYPGLIACFRRGYSSFMERDFFGVKGKNLDALNFVDRINIKAKLGNLVDVSFSPEEEVIRQRIHSAKTWAEVLEVTRALQDFVGSQLSEKPDTELPTPSDQTAEAGDSQPDDSQAPQDQGDSQDDSSEDTTGKSEVESDEAAEDEKDGSQSMEGSGSSEQASAPEDSKKDGEPTPQEEAAKPQGDNTGTSNSASEDMDRNAVPTDPYSLPSASTIHALESNTEKLLDKSREVLETGNFVAPTKAECREVIISIDDIMRQRAQHVANLQNPYLPPKEQLATEFAAFMKNTKKVVTNMVKEFELRKAAYQYARATESKTGALNLEKLHAYRVSDDLFLSVTRLANAKNHAMVLFVDYSGSMERVLPDVLKHLINVALFCRQANIPFRVYGFTSDNFMSTKTKTHYAMREDEAGYNRILISNLNLIELVNSDISTATFNQAIYELWRRSAYGVACPGESLGNTPLDETLIVAHEIIEEMQAKHNPDRMIAMFITDGDGNRLRAVEASESRAHNIDQLSYGKRIVKFKLNGKTIVNKDGRCHTKSLLENLSATTGAETIGFYIPASASHVRNHLSVALNDKFKATAYQFVEKCFETYKKEDLLHIEKTLGYGNYFVVAPVGKLDIDDEELEVDSTWTRSRIARSFINFSQNKKTSRVFVSKFAQAIA